MTAETKSAPKIWITWIAKLMGGNAQCRWAAWFKAHFHYDKLPETTGWNVENWTMEHNALLRGRKATLEAQGFTVFVEDQNTLDIVGKSGIWVSGKPDLVALTPDGAEFWVEDAKTGAPKTCDHAQVGIGMLLLPHTNKDRVGDRHPRGNVIYKNSLAPVKPIDPKLFSQTVDLIGGPIAPDKTPSWGECRYCDIPDCRVRVMEKPKDTTCDLF